MEYAATVWDPHYQDHIQLLEKIQRRAARWVCQDYDWYYAPTTRLAHTRTSVT